MAKLNRQYWFWLNNIEGIGNAKIRGILELFNNDPEAAYNAYYDEMAQVPQLTPKDLCSIFDRNLRRGIMEKYQEYEDTDIRFVFPGEKEYPSKLMNIYDRPCVLYYRGQLPIENQKSVAVVGSRNCSPYGRGVAQELGRVLAENGANVISGLALGIDTQAHRGAVMAGGRTYGVLAGSADICYPAQNFNLYMDMLKAGGVISEYPPGTRTVPGMFPLRNRIISGLADAVIVVEAGHKSGSLITVNHALEQNREVYAVPGRLGDPDSIGCNEIIAEGAAIISSYDTLLEELKLTVSHKKNDNKINLCLATDEKMLYSLLLDFTPKGLDTLIDESKLPPGRVFAGLLGLQMKSIIREISKNFYIRVI